VPVRIPKIIKTPPIVGVPVFFMMWLKGPSCLIGPDIFLDDKYFINGLPIKNTNNNDVMSANPLLNVKNLKTLNIDIVSDKFRKRL